MIKVNVVVMPLVVRAVLAAQVVIPRLLVVYILALIRSVKRFDAVNRKKKTVWEAIIES